MHLLQINHLEMKNRLLEISPTNFIPLKTFNLEFQAIAVWFADQNGHPLEKEDKINLTSVIT